MPGLNKKGGHLNLFHEIIKRHYIKTEKNYDP